MFVEHNNYYASILPYHYNSVKLLNCFYIFPYCFICHYIQSQPNMHQISLELQGALGRNHHIKKSSRQMHIWIELIPSSVNRNSTSIDNSMSSYRKKITKTWVVPLMKESSVGIVTEIKLRQIFDLKKVEYGIETANSFMCLQFSHNLKEAYPVSITVDLSPIDTQEGVIYAAIVLVGLYALIIFEVIHRTLAAMLASTISLATMALLGEKTTQMEVITWIDIESLLLLFSMMVMVAIFSETGIFDYLAVIAYKWTNGKMWSLINILCIFTIIVSALLDSVTTVLLMTPVTIRLCEVMKLNPVPILMAMIMYSNIGGAVTPIGDPPNVIIATNPTIQEAGVSFFQFTMHMGLGLIFVMLCVYLQLRFFIFRNNKMLCFKEPPDIQELRHEIAIWRKTANSVSSCSKDEDVVRETMMMKIRRLGYELKRKLLSEGVSKKTYTANLEEITNKFKIKNQALLVKSTLILVFVITTFFMSSSSYFNLPIGGTAILGAMLLLMIADIDDIETILSKVEWSTLIFFAALFIVMEALSRLGLIRFIGHQTEEVILLIDKEWRLAAAIMLILWVSALASSFVDNIPLTTMMIRIVISLNQNEELKLPLQPLVWSLALGACLGGNGTLIGSSSNVVCAGVAEQHGYKFTFVEFSKIGFPVMVFSVVCATIYLMIAHVIIGWNY
uniref:Citrate transporter-like domain-containing protein n=1 Tax=Clastoptera arizonana TaxID=38151 RepID=A0A1B6C5S4_9HEMI